MNKLIIKTSNSNFDEKKHKFQMNSFVSILKLQFDFLCGN